MVELVVVLLVLGIMATVAVPVFFDLQTYRVRSTYDDTAAAIRYAQKLAVSSGCDVQVVISGDGYQLQQRSGSVPSGSVCPTGSFTDITNHVVTGATFSAVTLSAQTFSFDAMGRCSSDVSISVDGGETITIAAATGTVDAP